MSTYEVLVYFAQHQTIRPSHWSDGEGWGTEGLTAPDSILRRYEVPSYGNCSDFNLACTSFEAGSLGHGFEY